MEWWAAGMAVIFSGCAATGPGADRPYEPVRFMAATGELEVLVRGDLLNFGHEESARQTGLDRIIFGERRRPARRLRTPQGMSFDGASLYVCDQGLPGIARIPVGGRSVTWMKGADYRFAAPLDVSVGTSGRVFVVDHVQGATCAPPLDTTLAQPWEVLLAPDEGHRPVSVAASSTLLVMGDARAGTIERFELPTGRRLAPLEYGAGGARIVAPTGLAFSADGALLVADAVQGIVHHFDAEGVPLAAIGRPGRGEGELVRPKDVAVTRGGRVAVADAGRQSVIVFDAEGRFLVEVRGGGDWPGFTMPGAVCVYEVSPTGVDEAVPASVAGVGGESAWVVVADTLGAPSLVLLELREARRREEGP